MTKEDTFNKRKMTKVLKEQKWKVVKPIHTYTDLYNVTSGET